MQDTIIGTAVLFEEQGMEYLMVRCQCVNGSVQTTAIPVYQPGQPKQREHQWKYVVRGDVLDVTPSLNWVGVFHNESAWSVRFQRFVPGGEWPYPGDLYRHLNGVDQPPTTPIVPPPPPPPEPAKPENNSGPFRGMDRWAQHPKTR